MKRVCLLLMVFAFMLCVGCTKEETGYIYRHDIELVDLAFLFNEWEYDPDKTDKEIESDYYNAIRFETIKPEDIFNVLGLPWGTTEDYGVITYTYTIGDEYDSVMIKYIQSKDQIDFSFSIISIENEEDEENLLRLLAAGNRTIDSEECKMNIRLDICEDELSFIDENITSEELQRALGAPHYYIELRDTNIESMPGNAFVYELTSGNVLKIVYYRQGYIVKAWVEDKDGKQIEMYIDRDTNSFYDEE